MAKKPEINTKSGERLRELIKSLGMTQKDFAEEVGITERTVTAYVNNDRRLTEYNARIIAEKFPIVRFEWLMGWDDNKNAAEQLMNVLSEVEHESNLLYTGTAAFASLGGYQIITPKIGGKKSLEEMFAERRKGFRICMGEETVTLDELEFLQFENEIFDFVELKFKHLFEQRRKTKWQTSKNDGTKTEN